MALAREPPWFIMRLAGQGQYRWPRLTSNVMCRIALELQMPSFGLVFALPARFSQVALHPLHRFVARSGCVQRTRPGRARMSKVVSRSQVAGMPTLSASPGRYPRRSRQLALSGQFRHLASAGRHITPRCSRRPTAAAELER